MKHRFAKELSESVLGEDFPRRRASRIRVTCLGEIPKVETHSELVTWLISQQLNFKKVFRSLVNDFPSQIRDCYVAEENSDTNVATVLQAYSTARLVFLYSLLNLKSTFMTQKSSAS